MNQITITHEMIDEDLAVYYVGEYELETMLTLNNVEHVDAKNIYIYTPTAEYAPFKPRPLALYEGAEQLLVVKTNNEEIYTLTPISLGIFLSKYSRIGDFYALTERTPITDCRFLLKSTQTQLIEQIANMLQSNIDIYLCLASNKLLVISKNNKDVTIYVYRKH
ncbi:MAG: hypothetical protein QXT64_07690 [Desulfurococcaceae archaeon]